MSRSNDLIIEAIKALEDGRDPFSDTFLQKCGVTYDEVMTLSEQLALGARLWLVVQAQARRGGVYAQTSGLMLAEAMAVVPGERPRLRHGNTG